VAVTDQRGQMQIDTSGTVPGEAEFGCGAHWLVSPCQVFRRPCENLRGMDRNGSVLRFALVCGKLPPCGIVHNIKPSGETSGRSGIA
jgi:hypothetical protein